MDSDVARWSLEFLLRNSVSDTLIKKIIATNTITLSDTDSRFKKTLLLRTLQDHLSTASVSETVLETLELIEELDRCDGAPITPAMAAAYCAVAVECTLKYLELSLSNNAGYLHAVDRIWRGRIRYMEPSASGDGSLLFSAELKRWWDDIEASLRDSQVMERIASINTRRDAINKLKVYLEEAWANMGPSFLELAASLPTTNKALPSLTGNLVDDGRGDCIGIHTTELDGHELGGSGSPAQEDREIQKDNKLLKRKRTATGAEEVDPSTTCSKIDSVPSVEVQKVRDSLKYSSSELQTLVKDPLPDALHMSDIVRSELAMKDMNQEPPIENQSKDADADADVPDPYVCQSINNNDANLNKTSTVHQSDVHHPSLMERNTTARTYEWDDSVDGLQGGASNRFHLPSPKRNNVSPLKKYEPENLAKRRKKKKWSQLEEDTLRTAVNKIGKGNWKLILNSHRDIFEERTEVDLKDKWRNMTRYGGK